MPHWVSATKIVDDYAVGLEKLVQYSARGNLPCKSQAGMVFYDLEHVAKLFRPRGALQAALPDEGDGFGKLGRLFLGQSGTVESSMPIRRHPKISRAESSLQRAQAPLAASASKTRSA